MKKNKKYEKIIEDYEQYIEELMGAYNEIENSYYIWKDVAHIYAKLLMEEKNKNLKIKKQKNG